MTSSDHESELSKARTNVTNPFTIAAASAVPSDRPAKHTRNLKSRRGIIPPKSSQRRPTTQAPALRASDDHSQLVEIPIIATERPDIADEEEEERESLRSVTQISHTPAPSSSISQTVTGKRLRSKTSSIHEHITTRGDQYICNSCSKSYSISGGTGAIARHLKAKHSIDPTASGIAEKRMKEGTSIDQAILRGVEINIKAEEKRNEERLGAHLDKETVEYLYLQWTVLSNIPFDQVRDRGFRTFLEYINPVVNRMLPDSDSTVKIHAKGLFAEGKQRLRHMLATAVSDIHITCDMWTSSNYLGLLGVIAHFTSEKGQLHVVTLALVELQGDHSGLNQAAVVLDVLNDFGIRNKLGYLVMDNAASNDVLTEVISDALREEGVLYSSEQRRLRCMGHVINLAVQAFLFGKTVKDYEYPENMTESPSDAQLNQWRRLGPLGKLHNINIWIMGSPQRIQSFKKRTGGLMPRRDNSTRWNSWYAMLDWAIERLKPAIIAVTNEEPDLARDILTAEEWKVLGYIRDFLRGFYFATKATEGYAATLERVLPTMDFLANKFEKAIEQFADHNYMRESLHTGYTKLLKYWNKTERSPAYIAAIVLDPTKKWKYFKRWNPDWQPDIEATFKRFWEASYRSSTGLANYASATTPSALDISPNNEFLQWQKDQEEDEVTGDEFEQYIHNHPFILPKEGRTALDWWLEPEQRKQFPLLSRMVIDIHSIPAMSSEPERVFSGARHTVSDQRASLKSKTIELLECLKSWFRLGIFTEQDLHAIVRTANEEDMEALEALEETLDY